MEKALEVYRELVIGHHHIKLTDFTSLYVAYSKPLLLFSDP
jgi:hypothetical protein